MPLMTQREYATQAERACPHCHGLDVQQVPAWQTAGSQPRWQCMHCGSRWTEVVKGFALVTGFRDWRLLPREAG